MKPCKMFQSLFEKSANGVRPSTGAATPVVQTGWQRKKTLSRAQAAVDEDGHTPNFQSRSQAFQRFASCWLLVAALGATFSTSSCVTERQVKSIVAESNAAALAVDALDVDLAADPQVVANKPDWRAASRKIDEFIAAHPDQTVAISALRVRQAILLMVNGEYELSRSAFGEATDLKTDRDKALKATSESLIWWWQHSAEPFWLSNRTNEVLHHLAAFDREIEKVRVSPDIRDFLAETRARIALKLAKDLQISQGKREVFVDALNHYGAIFTASDLVVIKSGRLTEWKDAVTTEQRRELRALAVIEKAKLPAQTLASAPQPLKPEDFAADGTVREFAELVLGR